MSFCLKSIFSFIKNCTYLFPSSSRSFTALDLSGFFTFASFSAIPSHRRYTCVSPIKAIHRCSFVTVGHMSSTSDSTQWTQLGAESFFPVIKRIKVWINLSLNSSKKRLLFRCVNSGSLHSQKEHKKTPLPFQYPSHSESYLLLLHSCTSPE